MSIEKGKSRDLVFILSDTNGYAVSSISNISSQISIDGNAFVYTTNIISEITGDSKSMGYYKLNLTDEEMNGDMIALAITPSSTSYERQNIVLYTTTISSQINVLQNEVSYISSQSFPSSNIINHGDTYWMSSNISTIWDESMADHKIFGTYGSGLRFVHQIESGRWLRSGNKMTFYDSSNSELAIFNLYTSSAALADVDKNAFERQRV